MVERQEALDRLNKEKEYEDSLVDKLGSYFLISLDSIPDISEREKKKLRESLLIIQDDSTRHSYLFNQLVQLVFKGESDIF
jgi:hypothetical protein